MMVVSADPATQEKVGVTYPSNGEPGARVTTIAPDGSLAQWYLWIGGNISHTRDAPATPAVM